MHQDNNQLILLVPSCQVNILVVKTSINQLTGHSIESRLTLDCSTIQIGKNVF